jgi:uncharacterized protein YxjI
MKPQYIIKDERGTFYHSDKKMTKLHREDGPAVEMVDGSKAWWLNGEYFTKKEHALRTRKIKTIEINGKKFTIEELNELIASA